MNTSYLDGRHPRQYYRVFIDRCWQHRELCTDRGAALASQSLRGDGREDACLRAFVYGRGLVDSERIA